MNGHNNPFGLNIYEGKRSAHGGWAEALGDQHPPSHPQAEERHGSPLRSFRADVLCWVRI